MSTMPRWPELFPQMKERGGRRRAGRRWSQRITAHGAEMQRIGTAMQSIDWAGIAAAVGTLGTMFAGVGEAFRTAWELEEQQTILQKMHGLPVVQDDFALVADDEGTHQ